MPKISDLDYVSEIDATAYLLGIKGGVAVRFPADVLQGEDPVVNTTFIGKGDTPASYTGQAGKLTAVNTAEDALEFIDAPTSLPVGGITGQVLTKQSAADGDADWDDASGGTEIAVGTTPPANPTDGQLWIDESQGVQDQNNFIDVTNFTTDYPLRRGETAVVNYSAATNVPLRIKTVEGEYEITITGVSTTNTNNNDITLSPNNTSYANSFSLRNIWVSSGNGHGTEVVSGTNAVFRVGQGLGLRSTLKISTITLNKLLHGIMNTKFSDGTFYTGTQIVTWNDVTTAWSSLGTITFPFSQSGTIIIKRIY